MCAYTAAFPAEARRRTAAAVNEARYIYVHGRHGSDCVLRSLISAEATLGQVEQFRLPWSTYYPRKQYASRGCELTLFHGPLTKNLVRVFFFFFNEEMRRRESGGFR